MQAGVSPGDVFLGKYRVERVLGQGGMGMVVAARHLHLGELFAIKLMLPAVLDYPDAVTRFLREARASARLKNEHIVRVHDVGSLENGAPYMIMEHLEGQDLKAVLRARGPLPLQEAALYVYQACEAVADAHALGIVHRDLKPANLFLTRRSNGSPCVKVLDFGISKELDPANQVGPDLTKTGMVMGSPYYMSPEQMAHLKAADPRSDIWSLGVILFQLLTGTLPFQAEAVTELVTRILQAPTPSITQGRPDLPPAIEVIVCKCLEKQREQRFSSVAELMAALRPFLNTAPEVTLPGQPMHFDAPPRSPLGSVPAEGIPGASAPSATTGSRTAEGWGSTSAALRGRSGKLGLVAGTGLLVLLVLAGGTWFALRGDKAAPAATMAPSSPASASGAASVGTMTVAPVVEAPPSAAASMPSPIAAPPPSSSGSPLPVQTVMPSAAPVRAAGTLTRPPPPKAVPTAAPRPTSPRTIAGFDD